MKKRFIQFISIALAALLFTELNSCKNNDDDQINNNNNSIELAWKELGGANTSPFNGPIKSIAVDNLGNVYAAGLFTNSDDKPYIAIWDKSTGTWSELGNGDTTLFNGGLMWPVAVDKYGNVYACGITRVPGQSDDFHVAIWNGVNDAWSELDDLHQPSFNNGLTSIITDATGNVYAEGDYIDWDTPANSKHFVAECDMGSTWVMLGDTTFENFMQSMVVDDNEVVYAAGEILNDNNSPYVVSWSGSSWDEVGGTNSANFGIGNISSLAHGTSGLLYAGGNFNFSPYVYHIAKYNSVDDWTLVDCPYSSSGIVAMVIDDTDYVYAAGFYKENYVQFVAKYDDNSWSDYGNLNANGIIYSLCIDVDGNIYAAGAFTNGNNAPYVAVHYK